MKVSKPNMAIFFISAFLFSLFFFISCSKTLDENVEEFVQANAFGKNGFSEMSMEEKNSYCKNLLESEEYRMFTVKINRFIPISFPALKDESFQRITTKSELMAWVSKNLLHTQFKSITDAEKTYSEVEQIQKNIQQKFSAIKFNSGSSDLIFLQDYMLKYYENIIKVEVKNYYPKKDHCSDELNWCMLNAESNLNICIAACAFATIIHPIVGISCLGGCAFANGCERRQCKRAYDRCRGYV